ncbi:MAG: hypothetical protein MZU91_04970 [Desulfosudis oleivorans]|nr:hypothetical protein [Desulfosudis oleivorans]
MLFQKVREAERTSYSRNTRTSRGRSSAVQSCGRKRAPTSSSVGKAEALLPQRETLPNENLKRGDIVKASSEVRQTSKGPIIVLSRTDANFIIGLLKMEVPEIHDGVVMIKAIAREPGERTKRRFASKDPSIDAVGACVGMKGTRVQPIVRELRGERIDIIPWSEDPRVFIARALTPQLLTGWESTRMKRPQWSSPMTSSSPRHRQEGDEYQACDKADVAGRSISSASRSIRRSRWKRLTRPSKRS